MGAWVRSPFCKRALFNKTFPRKNLVPQAQATCFSPWLCDFSACFMHYKTYVTSRLVRRVAAV